jgi:hypothetical protein
VGDDGEVIDVPSPGEHLREHQLSSSDQQRFCQQQRAQCGACHKLICICQGAQQAVKCTPSFSWAPWPELIRHSSVRYGASGPATGISVPPGTQLAVSLTRRVSSWCSAPTCCLATPTGSARPSTRLTIRPWRRVVPNKQVRAESRLLAALQPVTGDAPVKLGGASSVPSPCLSEHPPQ